LAVHRGRGRLAAVNRRRPSGDDDRSLVERAAHDLLNPISAILGLGETLRSRGASLGDEAVRSFGDSIARQATRLEQAIRDLARASLLLRALPEPETSEVPVAEIVASLAGERVTVSVPDGITVRADRALMASALARLVENALEYSAGTVEIRAGSDGSVWIEVADGGTGFTEEALREAFEPLAAGSNARNERGGGLGLGLFIARKLVEAHGGTLTATSAPGEGSVFRIELPA
jgi:signal transduction histidine kinase